MRLKHIFAEDFIPIGRLGKTRGNEGHLKAYFNESFTVPVKGDYLFLSMKGLPVPFRVEDASEKGEFILRFHEFDTPQKAAIFVNAEILQARVKVKDPRSKETLTQAFEEFSLWNNNVQIGIIHEVREYPGQWMLIVKNAEKEELLIPLVEDWIQSVDLESKELHMTLPDGLLS
ncbi:MAG TPA: hypothetical protein VJ917_11605 [Saprospiraceae bacterium]|nr:hypothetical protein [Saprospiraceae bacterium]